MMAAVETPTEWADWEIREIVGGWRSMLKWELDNPLIREEVSPERYARWEDRVLRMWAELDLWSDPATYPPRPIVA